MVTAMTSRQFFRVLTKRSFLGRVIVPKAISLAIVTGLLALAPATSALAVSSGGSLLKLAGPFSADFTYTLNSLPSCQVGDGSVVVFNDAKKPMRITKI